MREGREASDCCVLHVVVLLINVISDCNCKLRQLQQRKQREKTEREGGEEREKEKEKENPRLESSATFIIS